MVGSSSSSSSNSSRSNSSSTTVQHKSSMCSSCHTSLGTPGGNSVISSSGKGVALSVLLQTEEEEAARGNREMSFLQRTAGLAINHPPGQ